jgi:two-component system, cell cycle response regulator
MANNRSRSDARARPRRPAFLPVLLVAAAVAADALVRCLHRTWRLTRETRQLTLLSRIDPLTGLHNRRHTEEQLAIAVSAARRHRQPLSVLFLDIDGFKHINDELGYDSGDEVLRAVGERMRHALRAEDLVGRWGGEEFVAVLPTTDLAGAVVVAERVRAAVALEPVCVVDRDTHVTVSVGCASGVGEPAELILEAGRALRQAKRAGKNRVIAAGSPPD